MAFDREIATITIYSEASGEDHTTRLGVAYTILNRLGRFGSTVSEVCLKRLQFSGWNADPLDNANLLRAARCPDDDEAMRDCGIAFDQAKYQSVPDPTHSATHYYDVSMANNPPSWALGAIRTVQLGRLIFFRGVR